jgi:hypothetical protein
MNRSEAARSREGHHPARNGRTATSRCLRRRGQGPELVQTVEQSAGKQDRDGTLNGTTVRRGVQGQAAKASQPHTDPEASNPHGRLNGTAVETTSYGHLTPREAARPERERQRRVRRRL